MGAMPTGPATGGWGFGPGMALASTSMGASPGSHRVTAPPQQLGDRVVDAQALCPQRVEQPLLGLVHRQPPLAVEHLDRLGLLPQQEYPVRAVEGRLHLGRSVVVVGTLRGRAERS